MEFKIYKKKTGILNKNHLKTWKNLKFKHFLFIKRKCIIYYIYFATIKKVIYYKSLLK